MAAPVAPLGVTVDGVAYPLDMAAISAADEVMMARDLAIPSRIAMFVMVNEGTAERRHIVALMALSLRQQGKPVDLPDMLAAVTLLTSVEMTTSTDEPEPVDVDEALAALAALYMGGILDDDEFETKRALLTSV